MFQYILRLLKIRKDTVVQLGRWGYHWEKKKKYQIYYD